jgi:hypothetical protein
MATEAQMEQLIEAVENISLESDNTVSLAVDDYNLVSSIWQELHDISNTLKKIEAKMK